MKSKRQTFTSVMITDYCDQRLAPLFDPIELQALADYLVRLHERKIYPPYRGTRLNVQAVACEVGIEASRLSTVCTDLQPIFDAVARAIAEIDVREASAAKKGRTKQASQDTGCTAVSKPARRTRTPPMPKPIVPFPEQLQGVWQEPDDLASALRLHARRHGETLAQLHRAVVRPEDNLSRTTIHSWGRGAKQPRSVISLEILDRIERRYRLPKGYFMLKVQQPPRAVTGHDLDGVTSAERRRLAWHLPDDFNQRSAPERAEILNWVRTVIISGATDYRRYQAAAMRQHFAVHFACAETARRGRVSAPETLGIVEAPKRLNAEMADLLAFKTGTFAAFGFQRNGVWGEETAAQKIEHFGLWFGAFTAPRASDVQGFGADPERLTFAMMLFPQVWDWYLQWRERRRGFFTRWEIDLLSIAAAFTREETGWLRQMPRLAAHLQAIEGLIGPADIEEVRRDWSAACDRMYRHARRRIKEIERVVRVHRDPFEPILPVLEAASPVAEYRKITEEILRRKPDEALYPRPAAESVRAFLMLRLGLHTGLRQKNLRELLLCKRGELPTSERRLADGKRGELRWSPREQGWEILIPSVAFKNANSSFFGSKPFRLILPNLGGLYGMLDAYIDRHRDRLIGPATDPGTFFVKTAKVTSTNAAYDRNSFYEAWRLVIQRYGVYNPWTGRGAIEGLLPHGPHNVRDVLATHILKQTGSYEQASYAIQDTPEMVAQHYGRFLPEDKSEIAARILNRVWEAA